MAADHGGGLEIVEHAALDHALGATEAFLGRLEQEHVAPREVFGAPTERAGGTDGLGDVGIVAAGVHHTLGRRGEREVCLLDDGQGVDVGADDHGLARPPTVERPHGAGRRRAEAPGEPERPTSTVDELGGGGLVEAELGVLVELSSDVDHLVEPLGDQVADLLGAWRAHGRDSMAPSARPSDRRSRRSAGCLVGAVGAWVVRWPQPARRPERGGGARRA